LTHLSSTRPSRRRGGCRDFCSRRYEYFDLRFGWPSGAPGQVVDAAITGRFLLVTSPVLLDEFRRVLAYPKLAGIFADTKQLVELVAEIALVVSPHSRLSVVEDEADNRVLEIAVEAGADAVVTGDRDLLRLSSYEGISIMPAKAFVQMLDDPNPQQR
jgi:uncharacterized protein